MIAILQRVANASVEVAGETVGAIDGGWLALVCAHRDDTPGDAEVLARKTANLRGFEGSDGRWQQDVAAAGGGVLAVSQFTLYADCRKGTRPSFGEAAPPDLARDLYDHYIKSLRKANISVKTGCFGASMVIKAEAMGPVTLTLETIPGTGKWRGKPEG